MKFKKKTIGILEMLLASTMRGASQSTFAKTIETPIFNLTFFRNFIPMILVYFYTFLKGERIKNIFSKNKLIFHMISFLFGIRVLLFLLGYKIGSITIGTVIFFSFIVFSILLEPIFLNEKFSKKNFMISMICSLGIIIILYDGIMNINDKNIFFGAIIMTVSMILVVAEQILKKKYVHHIKTNEWIFYQHFVASLMFLPALFIFPFPDFKNFILIIIFVFITGVVAFGLSINSLKKIKLSTNSIMIYVEPIIAIIVGLLIFDEQLTVNMIIGGLLIFSSIWFVQK